MAEMIQDKDLKKIAVKAALDAHKDGMSEKEAHKAIYDAVLDANEGKPHKAAVEHGKSHFAKVADTAEEVIYEFAASDGISVTADPIAKDSKRPADKTDGQTGIPEFATKIEALNAVIGQLSGLPKQHIANIFKGLTDDLSLGAEKNKRSADNTSLRQDIASTRISPTSVAAEDMNVIFGGEELSEEVREKAKTIFEAAVNSRLVTEIARLEEEFEVALVDALEEKVEQLSENVDKYLSYAVEQWVEENQIAIESGLKSEVVEEFIHGLKNLFEESYVEIPDDKVDLVSELSQHVAALEAKINNVVQENVELKDYVDTLEVNKVFAEEVDALPLTQQEKLRSLVEGVEYANVEEFTKKLGIIKETYFPAEGKKAVSLVEDVEYVSDDEGAPKVASGPMAQYVTAISRTAKQ